MYGTQFMKQDISSAAPKNTVHHGDWIFAYMYELRCTKFMKQD
jgi:hypothetical protein